MRHSPLGTSAAARCCHRTGLGAALCVRIPKTGRAPAGELGRMGEAAPALCCSDPCPRAFRPPARALAQAQCSCSACPHCRRAAEAGAGEAGGQPGVPLSAPRPVLSLAPCPLSPPSREHVSCGLGAGSWEPVLPHSRLRDWVEGVPARGAGENPRRALGCYLPPARWGAWISCSGAAGLGRGQLCRGSCLLCARPRPAWPYGEGRRACVTSPAPSWSLSPNSLVCADGETEAQSPTAWALRGRPPPPPRHPCGPLRPQGSVGHSPLCPALPGGESPCPRGQQGPAPGSERRTGSAQRGAQVRPHPMWLGLRV